ncbi:MAG: bifunctional DNA-binding transcriptional regulator/O6-methylguanine-DNA methyltransferase Ada [Gammaproteobacteria bacterium]|nr:bifunctional DNA-binding transcriptional regulator/O6-methylguanine-DNA methyltransferase Ada [Gammaproteobacteria bacterium]
MNAERVTPPPNAAPMEAAQLAEQRWQAVVRRDPQADGEFVYAVRTTGVVCRPSCPSRAAKRQNVEFFESAELAVAAGYRPCQRCRPDAISLQQRWTERVLEACRAIEQNPSALTLDQLAQQAGTSAHHFQRRFKAVTGLSPKAYHKAAQARRMRTALQSAQSVTEAIYEAGFNSSGRFYEDAPALLGMSPGSYRKGGVGEHLRYAIESCTLGRVIVAATRKGICAIEFDESAQALEARIRERFPQAQFEPVDAEFQQWIAQVLRYIAQPLSVLDLPLDVQGTVFQRRVWQALQAIPAGQTASYAEIAERIGQPKAFRAVAHACAGNPVAVAIPCHRAVRADGRLAGYRWGIARKAELLRRENEE